jgi:beta-phosphoglucomutase
MDGARELIDALRAAGFRIAVGSSAPPENVRSPSTGSAGTASTQPSTAATFTAESPTRVFLLAASLAGVSAERCVVIEDAVPGIECRAARRHGERRAVSTGRTEDELRRRGIGRRAYAEGTHAEGLSALLDRARA